MEKDDEIAGSGNSYTDEYWQYDSRLGRRWNLDPVIKYHESPFAAFANNPIWFIDPEGLDTLKATANGGAWGDFDANHDVALLSGVIISAIGEGGDVPFENITTETSQASYGGTLGQYKQEYGLPDNYSFNQTKKWAEGALIIWNNENGLPPETDYETSFDLWYKTTNYYKNDQAHASSGMMIGGYIMQAQLGMYAFGESGLPGLGLKPILASPKSLNFTSIYKNIRTDLLKNFDLNGRPSGYFAMPRHKIWPQSTYNEVILHGNLRWYPNNTRSISHKGIYNGQPAEFQLGIKPNGKVIHNFIKTR